MNDLNDSVDLGTCCHCEKSGPTVRNVLMLSLRAPVPGTGWGCIQCGLPNDGAIAVLCDECLKAERPERFVCVGYAKDNRRMPIESLDKAHFDHDFAKHLELPTTERLALTLEAANDPALAGMIALARAGHYDDYKSDIAAPITQLVQDLEQAGHPELAKRARDGEFDATAEEGAAWFKSEGMALLKQLGYKYR